MDAATLHTLGRPSAAALLRLQRSSNTNGTGFDMAHAARLFQVFRRFHSEKDFPGTGIGLAIAKRIVERHGGQIWVESEPIRVRCSSSSCGKRMSEPTSAP